MKVADKKPKGTRVGSHVLFAEPPPKPDLAERLTVYTGSWGQRESVLWNPDDLASRKGLEIYDRMGVDDQVWSALEVKRLSRLATSWDIVSASEQSRDVEIRNFVADAVSMLPGSFDQKLKEFMSSIQFGFAIAEKLWKIQESGKWQGKAVYRDIKIKSPFGIQFVLDQYGNIVPAGIQITQGPAAGQRLNTDKFALWSYNRQFSNPYGRSDLRSAYRSWFSKELIIRYYNLHIERFASPTAICYIPEHMSESEAQSIRTLMEGLQNQTTATLPEGAKLEYLESRLGGAIAFKFSEAVDMHNRFIARAVLVPDLMGYSGNVQGGSFALGKRQIDVFFMILRALGNELEEAVIGEQIIRPLVDYNFSGVTTYPRFRFRDLDADLDTKAKIVRLLIESGAMDPREDWVRGYLDLPQKALPPPRADIFTALDTLRREKGLLLRSLVCPGCHKALSADFVADAHCQVAYHQDCLSYFGECTKKQHSRDFLEVKVLPGGGVKSGPWGTNGDKNMPGLPGTSMPAPMPALAGTSMPVAEFAAPGKRRAPTALERATPFQRIDRTMDKVVAAALARSKDVFGAIRDKLVATVRRRQLVARRDLDGLERLTVNVGEVQKLLHGMMLTMAGNGAVEAAMELSKKAGDDVALAEGPQTTEELLDKRQAKEFFGRQRVSVRKATIRIDLGGFLDAFFAQRAFLVAGMEKEHIIARARTILATAIRQGDPRLAEEQIIQVFEEYIPRGDVGADGRAVLPRRLYTVLGTTAAEAFNEGRRSVFDSDTAKDIIVAYQWSSVMDARTTEYCCPAGTQVRIAYYDSRLRFGFQAKSRAIERVRKGHFVLTQRGTYERVTATVRREYTGEMVEVAADGKVLVVTADHPVWTSNRGWVLAKDLAVGDDVQLLPRRVNAKDRARQADLAPEAIRLYESGLSSANVARKLSTVKAEYKSERLVVLGRVEYRQLARAVGSLIPTWERDAWQKSRRSTTTR